jgi:hypothetical protein
MGAGCTRVGRHGADGSIWLHFEQEGGEPGAVVHWHRLHTGTIDVFSVQGRVATSRQANI